MYPEQRPLRELIVDLLKDVAVRCHPAGEIYTNIKIGKKPYEGLDLLLEEPDRIVVVSFCLDGRSLAKVREEFMLLESAFAIGGIHKKLHFVLFHDQVLRASDSLWPVGVSFSAIDLPAGCTQESLVPTTGDVAYKFGSILFMDQGQVAAAMQDDVELIHDWRRFLTPEQVVSRMKELLQSGEELPPETDAWVRELLSLSEASGGDVRAGIRQFIEKLGGSMW